MHDDPDYIHATEFDHVTALLVEFGFDDDTDMDSSFDPGESWD